MTLSHQRDASYRSAMPIKPRVSASGPKAWSTAEESLSCEKSDRTTRRTLAYEGAANSADSPAAAYLEGFVASPASTTKVQGMLGVAFSAAVGRFRLYT